LNVTVRQEAEPSKTKSILVWC